MWSLIPWKWLAVAAVVGALGLAAWIQTERLDAARQARAAAEQQRDQWKQNAHDLAATAAANATALDEYVARTRKAEVEAQMARDRNAALDGEIEALRRRNRNVDPAKDGPVRPVLCDYLDGLRDIAGANGPACG